VIPNDQTLGLLLDLSARCSGPPISSPETQGQESTTLIDSMSVEVDDEPVLAFVVFHATEEDSKLAIDPDRIEALHASQRLKVERGALRAQEQEAKRFFDAWDEISMLP
jgi:hypothetical protein